MNSSYKLYCFVNDVDNIFVTDIMVHSSSDGIGNKMTVKPLDDIVNFHGTIKNSYNCVAIMVKKIHVTM